MSRRRRARTTITTEPSSAVGTPVGMEAAPSAPCTARSVASASRMSSAPRSPAAGTRKRWRRSARIRPAMSRAKTGAPRPTKAIGPARVTAVPVRTTAQITTITRVDRIGTPRVEAASSPRFMTSSRRDSARATHSTTTTTGRARTDASMFIWAREPLPQAKRPVVFSLNRMRTIAVAESRAIAIADPARMSRVPEVPAARPARRSTSAAAARPPAKATAPDAQRGTVRPRAATSESVK